MKLKETSKLIPKELYQILDKEGLKELRPAQNKAILAGLLEGENLLICTPTASGKTLCAELAIISQILREKGKAIYLVPLKALAMEKYKEFKRKFASLGLNINISIGDHDSKELWLGKADIIISVAEKLDSLLRHRATWVKDVKTVVIDEIHLLNDSSRGPTLEIIITLLRSMIKPQLIGLSATIGNPQELADWLNAKLVLDNWRPVELKQGIHVEETKFY